MKNFKKISLGLTALFLLAAAFLSGKPGHAVAATPSRITANGTTYSAVWVDRSHIQVNATKSGKTTSHILTDSSWDSNWEYTNDDHPNWSSCGSMKMNGFDSAIVGMTSRSGRGPWGSADSYGNFTVDDGSCDNVIDNQQITIGNPNKASISFNATASDTIQIIDQNQTMSFSNPRLQKDGTVRYYQDGQWGDSCQNRIIAVNFNNKTINQYFTAHQMEYADQTTDGTSTSFVNPNCHVTFTQSSPPRHSNGDEDSATISNYAYVLGSFTTLKKPSTVQDGNGSASNSGSGGAGSNDADTCSSSGTTGFEWILCPILRTFDGIANGFNSVIDKLLNFDVSSNLTSGVKNTWSIMKNIASALLVIIMLIAIFAQAVGGGPIDAYTVRKIIPRLVAAVILMQLSWPIMVWIIEVVNALGSGVRGLISAPFGGWQNLDLNHLIGPLKLTGKLTTIGLFSGLIGTVAFSGLTLGGIFLLACAAVLGMFIAFAILILRNMLVVLLVMLAPVAILLWILPGTERYWKMWWNNFIKLLMLFPLIMAIIYGGRVFAHVAAGNGANNGVAAGIIATFVIFVGYFGPYFFLPQAFKWGGQMFGAIAGGTWSATKGLRNAPARFAQSQAKVNRQQRETDRFGRLSYGKGRFGDRFLATAPGLGLNSSATRARQARNTAEGREAGEKEADQQFLASNYDSLDHQQKLDTNTTLAQGEFDEVTGLDGSNPAVQRRALDQLATFGDWDRIDAMRAKDAIDERTWQAFVAKNISAIHQNAPHLSPIRRDMSGLGYQEYATWKDHSFHELERQVTNGIVRTADAKGYEASKDPTKQRAEAIKKATDALKDDRVRANLSTEAVEVLTRISQMDANKEVNVTTDRQGKVAGVQIPSGPMLATNEQARANFQSALMPRQTGNPEVDKAAQVKSQAVIDTVASHLANPNLAPNDPERQGLEAYLQGMRYQAASSGNEQEIRTYNTIINKVQQKLAAYPQEVEANARIRGLQGDQLAAERQQAQAAADAERERTQGTQGRLKPI